MDTKADLTNSLLPTLKSANLSPTEHSLLIDFVESAVEPEYTAQYVLKRLSNDSHLGIENSLRHLKQDWRRLVSKITRIDEVPAESAAWVCRRDQNKCCMSPPSKEDQPAEYETAYVIPPSILRDSDMATESSLYSLLEAYLTPTKLKLLSALLQQHEDDVGCLRNLWLLSPSISSTFRRGLTRVVPLNEGGWDTLENRDPLTDVPFGLVKVPLVERVTILLGNGSPPRGTMHMFDLSTPNPTQLPLPHMFLLHTHFRLANALYLFSVEDKASEGWQKPSIKLPFGATLFKAFRWVWLSFPKAVRLNCYRLLLKAGKYRYPRPETHAVQRLPFGLYYKATYFTWKNEANSLRLVEKHTSVPAPRILEEFVDGGFTIMTRVPGRPLGEIFHLSSYPEREQLSRDLASCVSQLRRIPNNTGYAVSNTLGEVMTDPRIPGDMCDPFTDEADFVKHIIAHVFPEQLSPIESALALRHASYFTHSDLHSNNILMEAGRLSGIVDWEHAGYKPEYWEYTKAIYGAFGRKDLEEMVHLAFGNSYQEELEAERYLWLRTSFFA